MAVIRPTADIAKGTWTASTGTDLWAMLDETTRSDTDYIRSASSTGVPDVTTGLLTWYRLDNGSNGQASGQLATNYGSNTQTLQAGSASGIDSNDYQNSPVGADFNGDDYGYLAGGVANLAFTSSVYTQIFLARWNTLAGATSVKYPLIAHAAAGDRSGTIQGGGSGQLHGIVGGTGLFSDTGVLVANNWYMIHMRRNGTVGNVGVNTSDLMSSTTVANGTQGTNYRIGGSAVPAYLTGHIATYRAYNTYLSDADLLSVYRWLRANIATPRGIESTLPVL